MDRTRADPSGPVRSQAFDGKQQAKTQLRTGDRHIWPWSPEMSKDDGRMKRAGHNVMHVEMMKGTCSRHVCL